jgi:NAD-dependent deacetylase
MGKLIIFSGAGLSAESGIATFRTGQNNLWASHKIEEVCDISTWKANYDKVHAFYGERRLEIAKAEPNDAHRKVAEWQSRYETVIITQNIDDLLERAGCQSVVHLHGYAPNMMCQACGNVWEHGFREWAEDDRCKCGSRKGVKPGVVFFGEMAPEYAVLNKTLTGMTRDDIIVVIGTSGNVVRIGAYLAGVPGMKVLNNLEASASVIDRENDEEVYDAIFYEEATKALAKIDNIIRLKLGK